MCVEYVFHSGMHEFFIFAMKMMVHVHSILVKITFIVSNVNITQFVWPCFNIIFGSHLHKKNYYSVALSSFLCQRVTVSLKGSVKDVSHQISRSVSVKSRNHLKKHTSRSFYPWSNNFPSTVWLQGVLLLCGGESNGIVNLFLWSEMKRCSNTY